jgi:hypothetical protein
MEEAGAMSKEVRAEEEKLPLSAGDVATVMHVGSSWMCGLEDGGGPRRGNGDPWAAVSS